MAWMSVAPNFGRAGVIAGFVLTFSGAVVQVSKGVLFAQESMYRPANAQLVASPGPGRSYLFYNPVTGLYWRNVPTPQAAGDAALGWAVIGSDGMVRAVSAQRVRVADPEPGSHVIVPLGSVAAAGGGTGSMGDTDVPGQPIIQYRIAGDGGIFLGPLTFSTYANTASVRDVFFNLWYRDETEAAPADLAADVDAAATVWQVSSTAGLERYGRYLVDDEIVEVLEIGAGQITVERGKSDSTPAAHWGPKAITAATNATPIAITCAGHGRRNNAVAKISGALGNTAANGGWDVDARTADTFELGGSSGNGAYAGGGALAGSQMYPLHFARHDYQVEAGFLGTPEWAVWERWVKLPGALIAAVEGWVKNAFGASPAARGSLPGFTENNRTLAGGQIELQVEGTLGIQGDAVPEAINPFTTAVRDVYAWVKNAPVGANIQAVVKVNGTAWCTLTIPAGQTMSAVRTGRALDVIPEGAKLSLDITGVGSTYPGERLVVAISL